MPASPALFRYQPARKPNLLRRVVDAVTGRTPARRPWYPPSPYEDWAFNEISEAVDEAFANQTIDISDQEADYIAPSPGQANFLSRRSYANPIVVNRAFFQGDHWQNGDGWIGPHPAANDPGFVEGMQEIANIFTSKNVVKEATTRHSLGVAGKELQWGFVPVRELDQDEEPNATETRLAKEAMALMRPWLNNRKVKSLLKDAICTLLLSERAAVRLTVPVGLAQRNARGELVVVASSIEEALRFLYIEHPLPDDAVVVTDSDTKQEAGLWRYTAEVDEDEADSISLLEAGSTPAHLSGTVIGQDAGERDYSAICFVDETGQTVTRIYQEGQTVPESESTLNLGGKLPMFEMRRQVLITVQVQQGQRALNLAESMIPRTSTTAGFLERLLIDAQLPGKPEVDAEGNKTGRWIEEPFYVGAGTTNVVQSTEYMDEEGKVKRASAKMQYREPIPADGPIAASEKHYRAILDETGQLHVVMAGDSNPSGTSRVNARIEYLSTLQLTQSEAEACFRFIVDTGLAMAEALSGKPGQYTNVIRCQASCRLDTGPLLPAERTAIEASIGKTLSQETAMMLLGIEDIEAEKARMAADPLARAALGKAVGEALTALTTPGATLEGAAKFIGMDDALLKDLMSGELQQPTIMPVDKSPVPPGGPAGPVGGDPSQPSSSSGSGAGGGAPASTGAK